MNLQSLLERFRAGAYQAQPVRRACIPKGRGKSRSIGIPTFEDKVSQRAVAMASGSKGPTHRAAPLRPFGQQRLVHCLVTAKDPEVELPEQPSGAEYLPAIASFVTDVITTKENL